MKPNTVDRTKLGEETGIWRELHGMIYLGSQFHCGETYVCRKKKNTFQTIIINHRRNVNMQPCALTLI